MKSQFVRRAIDNDRDFGGGMAHLGPSLATWLPHGALLVLLLFSLGASHRTQNFIVTAATPQLALEVAMAAEKYRRELAREWLGKELPVWEHPCPITVRISPHLSANGETSFVFDRGKPRGWRMNLHGSKERILDSVLPHEITHTLFATHFGRPIPRWVDEGASVTVEARGPQVELEQIMRAAVMSGHTIGLQRMFSMTEYPSDVTSLYSHAFSLTQFLIQQGGKQKFTQYVGEAVQDNDWLAATTRHYGYPNLDEMQVMWLNWVLTPGQLAVRSLEARPSEGEHAFSDPPDLLRYSE